MVLSMDHERARIAFLAGKILGSAARVQELMDGKMPEDWTPEQVRAIGAACVEIVTDLGRARQLAD